MSKVDVLDTYWDKILGQFQMKATKLKDKYMTEVCKRIIMVPKNVRITCLTKYVLACKWVYAIGFFQWRLNQTSTEYYGKEAELEELIEKYVERRIIVKKPVNIETKRNKLQKGDTAKYDLNEG